MLIGPNKIVADKEHGVFVLSYADRDIKTSLDWKYIHSDKGKWVNTKSGLVVSLKAREFGNPYVITVYSLHNSADKTTDGNNEVSEEACDFEEALDIIERLCL